MASSSSQVGLTKSKELGKYKGGSRGGRPQRGERTVTTERVALGKECAGCEKHIDKVKVALMCSCKAAVYCSQDCKSSTSHKCGEEKDEDWYLDEYQRIVYECRMRYQKDQEMGRGPSSDKIKKLMKRTRGDQEHLLVLAEAGEPLAAYVVGEAYANRRVHGRGFTMPRKYLDKTFSETDEIAMKWLKIAAEGGVPEGMYLLSAKIDEDNGLVTDRRLAQEWRAKAYGTGKMDYVRDVLERLGLPKMLKNISEYTVKVLESRSNSISLQGPTLSHLLLASRWEEIRNWNGKTANGEPFFGHIFFRELMETLGGDLQKKDTTMSSMAFSQKKSLTIRFVSGRHGSTDLTGRMVPKLRNENNLKLKQGVMAEFSPDYQLIIQTSENGVLPPIEGRTAYQVNCKHDELGGNLPKSSSTQSTIHWEKHRSAIQVNRHFYNKEFQIAGECHLCSRDALQRLNAVAKGLYSLSINQLIPDYGYAARYLTEDGVIVQDVFKIYSKPCVRQVLQCLMSNKADLHPAAVAEDQNLYWTIVWYWGDVFHAVQEICGRNTVEAIYGRLGERITLTRSQDASALAAFPESAAGEWRMACGSEDCPRVDHDVKFSLCRGCKVRRYCNEDCQRNDWPKHKPFCKADKGGSREDS